MNGNGMITEERVGRILLKGRTVDAPDRGVTHF
jgi:hypothetical protein